MTTERPSPRKIGWRSCQFHLRNVSFWPLKAAIEKSSERMKASIFSGSAPCVRVAASPTMRTAVQAAMSFDSMRRPFALAKRFWICVPPHCSLAGCQADGISPAVPATGRGIQVRNGT